MAEYRSKNKTIYMMVTANKYELPIAISDTLAGLARDTGHKLNDIYAKHKNWKKGHKPRDYGIVSIKE